MRIAVTLCVALFFVSPALAGDQPLAAGVTVEKMPPESPVAAVAAPASSDPFAPVPCPRDSGITGVGCRNPMSDIETSVESSPGGIITKFKDAYWARDVCRAAGGTYNTAEGKNICLNPKTPLRAYSYEDVVAFGSTFTPVDEECIVNTYSCLNDVSKARLACTTAGGKFIIADGKNSCLNPKTQAQLEAEAAAAKAVTKGIAEAEDVYVEGPDRCVPCRTGSEKPAR